jgi:hypothetical protein
LTIGDFVFVSDSRVGVIHPDVTNGFTLSIMDVRMSDTGVYECQFGVRNPSRQCFGLQVVQTWQWNLFGLFLIVVFLWYYVCLIHHKSHKKYSWSGIPNLSVVFIIICHSPDLENQVPHSFLSSPLLSSHMYLKVIFSFPIIENLIWIELLLRSPVL